VTDDPARRLRVDDFDYDLPTEAIAQLPAEPRDASRLLVLDRAASSPSHPALDEARFADVGRWLTAGDLLVVNDSRVLRARRAAPAPAGERPRSSSCGPWPTAAGRRSCGRGAACNRGPRSDSRRATRSSSAIGWGRELGP
jgi:hypothetical protein